MNCKHIQGLILTDYLDDQADDDQKAHIEIHLTHCQLCRDYLEEAKKTIVNPFVGVKTEIAPPEAVWQRIKESILTAEEKKTSFNFLDKVKFDLPKTRFAIITVTAIAIAIGLLVNLRAASRKSSNTILDREIEYLTYSAEASTYSLLNNIGDFGTLIEEFFL